MEAVNLQAKKMGAQYSAFPTEVSLGVYRCGQEGHLNKDRSCPAYHSVCTKCKKVGHYASECKMKPSNDSEQPESSQVVDKESLNM